MSDCKLKKYGCTYNETGCSDCKVNQAIQDERERICNIIKDELESGYLMEKLLREIHSND